MEAMGQLTGGVAHDFNNLLTPIVGGLDMLVRRGIGSEREQRLIDGALQSAERAKVLVQRLLAFARRQPLQPVSVNIPELVNGLLGLMESTLGPTIDSARRRGSRATSGESGPKSTRDGVAELGSERARCHARGRRTHHLREAEEPTRRWRLRSQGQETTCCSASSIRGGGWTR